MIEVRDIYQIDQVKFGEFLARESQSSEPAAENMRGLSDLIHSRFKEAGCFHVLVDDGNIIGCGGAYLSTFCEDVALLGCRSWLTKEARNKSIIRDVLLPIQRSWAVNVKNAKVVALSFNDYNKNLRELFRRRVVKRAERSHEMMFFRNENVLDFPVLIQHVPQWIIYEKMTDWDFDWESIRA
jgi:hypothetical protein